MDGLTIRQGSPADSEFAFRVRREAFKEYEEQVNGWDEEDQRRLRFKVVGETDTHYLMEWNG